LLFKLYYWYFSLTLIKFLFRALSTLEFDGYRNYGCLRDFYEIALGLAFFLESTFPPALRGLFFGLFMNKNALKEMRISLMYSRSELARKAGVSHMTIERLEKGEDCRLDTKRKILLALGLSIDDKEKVFGQ
jgi:DNA-binding XRE family transcriptional regulator